MYVEASICVDRAVPDVWAFFADPMNLTKWDRSVERVVITGATPAGVGLTFDTFTPAKHGSVFRSSYRVTQYVPGEHVWVDLTNPKLFSTARWLTALEPVDGGTRVRTGIALTLRLRYFFLWPVFRFTARAIARDLEHLKRTLESES